MLEELQASVSQDTTTKVASEAPILLLYKLDCNDALKNLATKFLNSVRTIAPSFGPTFVSAGAGTREPMQIKAQAQMICTILCMPKRAS